MRFLGCFLLVLFKSFLYVFLPFSLLFWSYLSFTSSFSSDRNVGVIPCLAGSSLSSLLTVFLIGYLEILRGDQNIEWHFIENAVFVKILSWSHHNVENCILLISTKWFYRWNLEWSLCQEYLWRITHELKSLKTFLTKHLTTPQSVLSSPNTLGPWGFGRHYFDHLFDFRQSDALIFEQVIKLHFWWSEISFIFNQSISINLMVFDQVIFNKVINSLNLFFF